MKKFNRKSFIDEFEKTSDSLMRSLIAPIRGYRDPDSLLSKQWLYVEESKTGEKYITPLSMSYILMCDCDYLCEAVGYYKLENSETIDYKIYGTKWTNCDCEEWNKIRIQGWIDFLSIRAYSNDDSIQEIIKILKNIK